MRLPGVRRRPAGLRLRSAAAARGLRARRRRALRRAARRALLDDRPRARRLHAGEQRRRHAQPALRAARAAARLPSRQARHHGRVRHARHRHRRGLPRGPAQGPPRRAALPQAARLLLPPVQGPRLAQHHVLLPRVGAARDRPEPGHRLRHAHRRDRAPSGTDQPLRLRRGLRHRAQPLLRPGRDRPPADGLRRAAVRRAASSTSATPCAASSSRSCTRRRPASTASSTSSPSSSRSASWPSGCGPPPPAWPAGRGASTCRTRASSARTHYYRAVHTRLRDLGLEPHLLSDSLLHSLLEIALRTATACAPDVILPRVDWRRLPSTAARRCRAPLRRAQTRS